MPGTAWRRLNGNWGMQWKTALLLAGILALQEAEAFTVATYNVENYTLADRIVDGTYRKEYPKSEEAKAALRRVLRAIDADVLILQEMGSLRFLEELRDDLAIEGLKYSFAHVVSAADGDRHLAVLARMEPETLSDHTDLTFRYLERRESVKRGLLQLDFRAGLRRLSIYGVHLKSRLTDVPEDPESERRRVGEATAIRNRILEVQTDPQRDLFLIAGDFNDHKASRAVRAFLQRGKLLISEIVPAVDRNGDRWTYHFEKRDTYDRVDLLLASPALKPHIPAGAARVWDGPDVASASDHRPVVISIDWPAMAK